MSDNLLVVDNLTTELMLDDGPVNALDGISFTVNSGEILGVVGESGCGKSLTALSIMQLLAENGCNSGGSVLLEGDNLLRKSKKEIRAIRGNLISMIFQEPMTSLNPVYTVGNQIMESILLHQKCSRSEARKKAIEALQHVGIPLPKQRFSEFPHQLSGGMRQRVMIAMALACKPKLLIADEPTTALDVTIQAQILRLIRELRDETDMGVMLITHDLGVVAEMCNRIVVMYAGRVIETGPADKIFEAPLHPYTEGLLNSIPRIRGDIPEELPVIEGMVPQLSKMPQGCRFNPRCPYVEDICRSITPELTSQDEEHHVACWKYQDKPTGA